MAQPERTRAFLVDTSVQHAELCERHRLSLMLLPDDVPIPPCDCGADAAASVDSVREIALDGTLVVNVPTVHARLQLPPDFRPGRLLAYALAIGLSLAVLAVALS